MDTSPSMARLVKHRRVPNPEKLERWQNYLRDLVFHQQMVERRTITRQEIALHMNPVRPVNLSTLNKWWRGETLPTQMYIYDIARLFHRPIEEVMAAAGFDFPTWEQFYSEVAQEAVARRWTLREEILHYLRYTLGDAWRTSLSDYAVQGHVTMTSTTMRLEMRGPLVARAVMSWISDPDRDRTFDKLPLLSDDAMAAPLAG